MNVLEHARRTPLTVRAPAMVAILMLVVSVIISERVLDRLHEMQQQHLDGVVGTYFDGLSTALMPAVLRQDVWETYDVLDRTRTVFKSVSPVETVVTGRDGRVLASSDPHAVPVLSELPAEYADRNVPQVMTIDWQTHTGFGVRPLIYQGKTVGAIHASFDISHLIAERRDVLNTLLATNAVLALGFAAVGYLLARRMVKPVTTLAEHMLSGAAGKPQTIALEEFPHRSGEFADLFHGFNALVEAQRERSDLTSRLAEEEKLASLGRLASSMAHEINNPLGGLFNAIDTLKRHGADAAVRETGLSLLDRGLRGIRDVVQAALATYRPDPFGRPLVVQDLEDVRLLAGPAVAGRNQTLDWSGCSGQRVISTLPGSSVRQALLNLVLNASAAAGEGGRIDVRIALEDGDTTLVLSVSDSGPGLSPVSTDVLTSAAPLPASYAGGGLGLWMVRRLIDDVGGRVDVHGGDGGTTVVVVRLPVSMVAKEDVSAAA